MDTRNLIKGIHHVTATVFDAQEDFDFYTKILGQRLVKKTVNFDNNQVYHFYYGNELGTPGTIMTTFPYRGQEFRGGVRIRHGKRGTGQVATTAFSVPANAIDFWKNRLERHEIEYKQLVKFGNPTLQFLDPAGLYIELVANEEDKRIPWTTKEINYKNAIKGFYTVTLSIAEVQPTFDFLTKEFGFQRLGTEGRITRLAVNGGKAGRYVDVRDDHDLERGHDGIGTVHHVAWQIETEEGQLAMRRHLVEDLGLHVTEVKDRKYFRSIYFRMPGHVLFEIATIPPGFTLDETVEELGSELKLPPWEEPHREQIESVLPEIVG